MKASEVITKLVKQIEKYGDLDVVVLKHFDDGEVNFPSVSVVSKLEDDDLIIVN